MLNVNLGCGPVFIDSSDWLNLDFSPSSYAVRQANLLGRLPLADESSSLVYSSHFLEHVPRTLVAGFLRECLRVLQPGEVVRLVVPDLENMAREYLAMREAGAHDKADFVVMEMIDQCVRRESGGELGRFYRQMTPQQGDSAALMIDYIRARTGDDLRASAIEEGAQPAPHIRCFAQSRRARLDPSMPACPAGRFPRAKHQPGGGGRAAPLAVGFLSAQGRARSRWIRRCAATKCQQQRRGRFSVPAAGSQCRGLAAKGGGITLRGGALARPALAIIAPC